MALNKNQPFNLRNFADFKDLNDFTGSFKFYAETLISTNESKHNLRAQLFKQTQLLSLNQVPFKIHCSIQKKRPQNHYLCALYTTCKSYHMYNLEYIYEAYIKSREEKKPLTCTICKGIVTKPSQITIDILAFHFFDSTQDSLSRLILTQKKISSADLAEKKQQINQLEYQQTLIEDYQNQNILVNLKLDIKSKDFVDFCSDREAEIIYNKIISKNERWLHQLVQDRQQNSYSISLICPIYFRRISNCVFHRFCSHNKIVVFDLQNLLMDLFKDQNKIIRCPEPFCESQFNFDNIEQVVVVDNSLRNSFYKEPNYSGSGQIKFQKLINRSQQTQIQSIMKSQPDFKTALFKEFMDQLKKQVGRFWRIKYDENKYKKNLEKIKCQQFEKLIVDKKVQYPVRCTKCENLNVMDLWIALGKIYFSFKKKEFKCPINGCAMKKDQPNIQKLLYIDVGLFRCLQRGISNLVFNKKQLKYYADINSITGEQILAQIASTNNIIKKQSFYYTKDSFSIKIQIPDNRYYQYYLPLILKNCLSKNNPPEHIFYLRIQNKDRKVVRLTYKDFSCKICQTSAQQISDIYYDKLLAQYMKTQRSVGFYDRVQKKYRQRRTVASLTIEALKSRLKISTRQPSNNSSITITNFSKSSVMKIPVISPNCNHPFQTAVFDLADFKDYSKELYCNISKKCPNRIIYEDQIEYLKDYKQLIDNIYSQEGNQILSKPYMQYQIDQGRSCIIVPKVIEQKKVQVLQTLRQIPKPVIKSIGAKKIEIQKPVFIPKTNLLNRKMADKLQQLIHRYEKQYQELIDPQELINKNNTGWDSKQITTYGGIHVFNSALLQPFP